MLRLYSMLGHSISTLQTTYAHFIPTMQDEAAHVMDDILTPVQVYFISLHGWLYDRAPSV